MNKMNSGRAPVQFIVGLSIGIAVGATAVLLLAQQASRLFLEQHLYLLPLKLAVASASRASTGDLESAERMLRAEIALLETKMDLQEETDSWGVLYPVSSSIVQKLTAGMRRESDGGTDVVKDLCVPYARLARLIETQGRPSDQLYKVAVRICGATEDGVRAVAENAQRELEKIRQSGKK